MPDLPLAYPVPWLFIRDYAPRYGLKNASLETLRNVWCSLLGPGALPLQLPVNVEPGQTLWVPVHGADLARDTLLVVRWRRENGEEYLWRAAF
ncbi:hypothetical protein [Gryllotalpicola ginsengisoli]|uniref:hypothetical protein n=1 Tax=Gryllotalpicola ginsengisoli TaxID=444608 RepID=UPI0004862861|nr:hypothetical protein [Gryllotalpicola ginsengisoli]